jgi:hypothetical protein
MMVFTKIEDIFNRKYFILFYHTHLISRYTLILFHFSKSNKGVFVSFSKIVMAWG